MKDVTITFIGGGNMATSLIGGLLADHFPADRIHVADQNPDQRGHLAANFRVQTHSDNRSAAEAADVVVLAVKPQVLKTVCEELADVARGQRPLFVSVAAGVRSQDIERWLGCEAAVVRAMPNTPALIQTGATGLYANPRVSPAQRDLAESILRAAGLTLWVDGEAQMDAVTALSGSGPAYFFRIMEGLQQAGMALGLSEQAAHLLTLQTALGAAKMAIESPETLATLRERVTSPGGTTEQGLKTLDEGNIDALLAATLQAVHDRAKELADLLGDS